MRCGRCENRLCSPWWPCSRWRWASAPTRHLHARSSTHPGIAAGEASRRTGAAGPAGASTTAATPVSNAISYPMYQDFRDKNQVFSGMFCKFGTNFSLSFEGRTELVSGSWCRETTSRYWAWGALWGVFKRLRRPHPGRGIRCRAELTVSGGPGLPETGNVVGARILVNGYPLTIVGVSQAGFDGVEVGPRRRSASP